MRASIETPTLDELRAYAQHYFLDIPEDELPSYQRACAEFAKAYECLDILPQEIPKVKYPRGAVRFPSRDENPGNAWYCVCEVRGNETGPLSGKRLAVKDNIALANVPMMNGSRTLEGYIPEFDATVVSRALDAGAMVAGKATCEDLCVSGTAETAATGPVSNPFNPEFASGGSSSGCAWLLARGEVDLALGCDQGGSIRMPAAWAGIVGLKPTFGLVPYTGIMPIEPSMDHVGPMARNVTDVAKFLNVIAGPDGEDPRQSSTSQACVTDYSPGTSVTGWKIGLVSEGFSWVGVADPGVASLIEDAARSWTRAGAMVEWMNIPEHQLGFNVMAAIGTEGSCRTMFDHESALSGFRGFAPASMIQHYAEQRRRYGHHLYPSAKMIALMGRYLQEKYYGLHYVKAQNALRHLRRIYDTALEHFDLLVMPTIPFMPPRLRPESLSLEEKIFRADAPLINTAVFNGTGHPAISLNAGFLKGLPVGLMAIGKHHGEQHLLTATHVLEQILALD
jgi:amidase